MAIVLKFAIWTGHPTMPAFYVNSRYVLLTYAQSGSLDPFDVVDHLASIHGECIVGREHHRDGGVHLHAFVDFGRKFRSRSATVFDVAGFHPNISPSFGNPGRGFDYAIKDGDICAGGLERPGDAGAPPTKDVWSQIVMAKDRDEFWSLLRQHQPRALATSFVSLQKYADWHFRVDPEPYRHDPTMGFQLDEYPELDMWVDQYLRTNTTGS